MERQSTSESEIGKRKLKIKIEKDIGIEKQTELILQYLENQKWELMLKIRKGNRR
jgi:hypothetical protein